MASLRRTFLSRHCRRASSVQHSRPLKYLKSRKLNCSWIPRYARQSSTRCLLVFGICLSLNSAKQSCRSIFAVSRPMQGGGGVPLPNAAALPPQQQQQQQQSADYFLQNSGVNMPSTGSIFGNMGPKQGELNPFVPGSQANAIASGLLAQPTPSQQLQQLQLQQQAHTQQQKRSSRISSV